VVLLGIAVFLLFLSPFLAVGSALILTRIYFERRFQAGIDAATAELEKLAKGEPCQSASILNAIGQLVGSEAGRSAKASLMADLSHAKRQVNSAGVDAEAEAIGEGAPGLGSLLAGMSGGRKKSILNNPLVQLALAGLGRGSGNGSGSGSGSRVTPRSFKM
jgi:hypothetical protein